MLLALWSGFDPTMEPPLYRKADENHHEVAHVCRRHQPNLCCATYYSLPASSHLRLSNADCSRLADPLILSMQWACKACLLWLFLTSRLLYCPAKRRYRRCADWDVFPRRTAEDSDLENPCCHVASKDHVSTRSAFWRR